MVFVPAKLTLGLALELSVERVAVPVDEARRCPWQFPSATTRPLGVKATAPLSSSTHEISTSPFEVVRL